jgi:hypothetical protein
MRFFLFLLLLTFKKEYAIFLQFRRPLYVSYPLLSFSYIYSPSKAAWGFQLESGGLW